MKEEQPRLLVQHVTMDRRHVDPIRPQRRNHWIHFVACQNKISGDSGFPAASGLEVDRGSHAHRTYRSNLHSAFHYRIATWQVELINTAVGLTFDSYKLS